MELNFTLIPKRKVIEAEILSLNNMIPNSEMGRNNIELLLSETKGFLDVIDKACVSEGINSRTLYYKLLDESKGYKQSYITVLEQIQERKNYIILAIKNQYPKRLEKY